MGFKDKFAKTMNVAAEKSTELAGKAKTKMDIANKKSSVKEKYRELGELVYEAKKEDRDPTEEVAVLCDLLEALHEEIQALEESE